MSKSSFFTPVEGAKEKKIVPKEQVLPPSRGPEALKMEGEDEEMPFLESLLAVLPFTKQAKRSKKLLETVNHPSYFTNEKKKVERIEHLLQSGKYDEALTQLVMDTDTDNPIQYFNRIRCNEQKTLLQGDQNSPQLEFPSSISKNRVESVQIAATPNHKCQWTGFNEKFDALECANEKFCHPWKECINVCNQVEPVTSNFCIYHEKYCVDKGKRHKDEMIIITVPNIFGVCSECHILQEGNPPAKIRRHPGVRRKFCLKEKKMLRPKSMSVERMDKGALLREYNPMDVVEKVEVRKDTQVGMSRIIAARNIGQNLRMSLVRKKKVRQDDLHHLRSTSAVWIQSLFRYYKLRQRMKYLHSKEIIIHNSGEQGEVKEAREKLETSSQQPSRAVAVLYSEEIHEKCPATLYLPCTYISQKCVSRRVSGRLSTKCEASACQVCNESKRLRPLGRQKVCTYPYHNDKITDDTFALENLFLQRDRFELGSLPRHVFLEVLRELWQKSGQYLLLDETLAIMNAFECRDGRDGHISYVKYAQFASNQVQPCSLHSRIVCPDAKCIHRSKCYSSNNCIKYQEDPKMPLFCVCGNYRSRHDPLPLMNERDVRKRGFRMFSSKNLRRTLQRQTKPDTGSEITFNSLKDSMSRSCIRISHDKNRRNVRDVHSLPSPENQISINDDNQGDFASCEQWKERTQSTNESRRCSKEYVEDEANAIIFSSKRLSVMLNDCVEYRKASSQKRITTPCPLCELGFFDINLLQNHLMRRHTLSEIEYALSCHRALQCGDHDGHTHRQIRVDWVGSYITVPPLPSLVPLNLCHHHVPPHPKCNLCRKTANSSPLFPPIRFYQKSFVECRTHAIQVQGVEEEGGDEFTGKGTRCFHFDLEDDELAVVYKEDEGEEGNVGKLVALCEDARNKYFVGVQRYLSTVPHSVDVTVDLQSNEWIIESAVKFIDMTKIVGRRRVVHCSVEETINHAAGALKENFGFCRYSVTNNTLVPL